MKLSAAQQAALEHLNAGGEICLGSKSTTYARFEIMSEGLEIIDFKLIDEDFNAFRERCEEVIHEWLEKHHEALEMKFEQNQIAA